MKINETRNCQVCQFKESIIHLYWDCPRAKRVWERLKTLIEEHSRTYFNLDKEKYLLGTGVWISNKYKEINHLLCTPTKYYTHLCKCNDSEPNQPSPTGLDMFIRSKLKLELTISNEKEKYKSFTEKWGRWLPWINM